MDVMAIFNLVTIIFLSKYVFAALKNYMKQKEAEKKPVFSVDSIPSLENTACWEREKTEEKIG
ncbi:alanine:cation symporter family protein [Bacillus cereus]|uniref:alanine:cation symporter family protein n=1 Tax=Bacillus cereus TaxID=1396 RepID=UPI0020D20C41